jgi:adenine-specific DNA-methyltransferase
MKYSSQQKLAKNVVAFEKKLTARIECKDNLKFMRSLDSGSMKLIVTSPPYNIGKDYEKRTTNEIYIEQQTAAIAEAVRLLHRYYLVSEV